VVVIKRRWCCGVLIQQVYFVVESSEVSEESDISSLSDLTADYIEVLGD
jgi:hypothetical protein